MYVYMYVCLLHAGVWHSADSVWGCSGVPRECRAIVSSRCNWHPPHHHCSAAIPVRGDVSHPPSLSPSLPPSLPPPPYFLPPTSSFFPLFSSSPIHPSSFGFLSPSRPWARKEDDHYKKDHSEQDKETVMYKWRRCWEVYHRVSGVIAIAMGFAQVCCVVVCYSTCLHNKLLFSITGDSGCVSNCCPSYCVGYMDWLTGDVAGSVSTP